MQYKYLSLNKISIFEPLARSLGVSQVARSAKGFLSAYKRANGSQAKLSEYWRTRRNNFIKRHMAQVIKRKEKLVKNNKPTRRLLALIMWAYSPIKL